MVDGGREEVGDWETNEMTDKICNKNRADYFDPNGMNEQFLEGKHDRMSFGGNSTAETELMAIRLCPVMGHESIFVLIQRSAKMFVRYSIL